MQVPGLFEGDERTQLLSAFREGFGQREGETFGPITFPSKLLESSLDLSVLDAQG